LCVKNLFSSFVPTLQEHLARLADDVDERLAARGLRLLAGAALVAAGDEPGAGVVTRGGGLLPPLPAVEPHQELQLLDGEALRTAARPLRRGAARDDAALRHLAERDRRGQEARGRRDGILLLAEGAGERELLFARALLLRDRSIEVHRHEPRLRLGPV